MVGASQRRCYEGGPRMNDRAARSLLFRKRPMLTVGLGVALIGGLFSVFVAADNANGSSYAATDGSEQMVLPDSSQALNDGEPLAEALRILQSGRHSSTLNHVRVDDSSGEVEIYYDGTADPVEVQNFLAEVESLPKISGVTVSTSAMDYSRQASQAVVEEMFDEREYWAEVFGSPMYGLGVDSETGEVRIALSKEAVDESKNVLTEKNGVPIVFEVFPDTDEAEIGPQVLSRVTEVNP